jgi:hypothetical protein
VLLISRQGKVRLTKWYSPYTQKERTKVSMLYCFMWHTLYIIFAVSVLLHCLFIFEVGHLQGQLMCAKEEFGT